MRKRHLLFLIIILGFLSVHSQPIQKFIDNANVLKSEGWVDDHERLIKIRLYNIQEEKLSVFSGLNFYQLEFEESRVNTSPVHKREDGSHLKKSLSKAISIWAFFYRKEPKENLNPDGLIEQWEFSSKEIASGAFNELSAIARNIYVNTRPYYFQYENFIFIFHTRAMAFSYEQESIYENFKERF